MTDIIISLYFILTPALLVLGVILWVKVKRLNKLSSDLILVKPPRYQWIIYVWFSIGIVALVVGVFDISSSGLTVRDNKLASDTILSILVTFLVAWQIWQTVDVKKSLENFQTEYNKLVLQSKLDFNDCTLLNNALLAQHEAYEFEKEKDYATAYIKFASALYAYCFIHKDSKSKGDSIKHCEKKLNEHLEKLSKERRDIERRKFEQYDKDIDIMYEAIIELSKQVKMEQEFIDRLKTMNKNRKNILSQWS